MKGVGRLVAVAFTLIAAVACGRAADREPAPPVDFPVPVGESIRAVGADDPRVEPLAAPVPIDMSTAEGWLRGRVLAAGQPSQEATVRLVRELACWPDRRTELVADATTDEWGLFAIDLAHAGSSFEDLTLEVTAEGFAPHRELLPPATIDAPGVRRVRLAPGFVVRGMVFDPNGSPLEGCRVYLEPSGQELREGQVVETSANGVFEFTNVRAGIMQVVARDPEQKWQPVRSNSVTAGGIEQLVRLQFDGTPGFAVSGRVTRAETNRQPVEGVVVHAFPVSNAWLSVPMEARTDARGRFRIGGLGRESLELRFTDSELSITTRIASVRGAETSPLDVEMVAKSRVSGQVVGELGKGPVELRFRTMRGEMFRALVDDDRTFSVARPVSVGPLMIEVVDGMRVFADGQSRWLRTEVVDGPVNEYQLQVVSPGVLRGRIVDGFTDEPVVGAVLSADSQSLTFVDPTRVFTVTDTDGEFVMRGLRPGKVDLEVQADGYALTSFSAEAPGPGAERRAQPVELQRPGSIVGSVFQGEVPLEGAIVSAGRSIDSPSVATDENGDFKLSGLAPGAYRVKARFSTLPIVGTDRPVVVQSRVDTKIEPLVFEPGRVLSGTIVDEDGSAVASAVVFVEGAAQYVRTDLDGYFEIEAPRRAQALVYTSPDERVSVSRAIGPSDASLGRLQLALPKRGAVLLRVRTLPDRAPVFERTGGALVRYDVSNEGDDDTRAVVRWVSGSGDRLRIEDVPQSVSELSVQCPGYAPCTAAELEVAPGSVVEPRETLLLEPGARLEGLVTGPDGPIAGAIVHLGEERDLYLPRFVQFARTDANGRFAVQGVSAAASRLTIAAQGHATRSVLLDVPTDLLIPREFALTRCSTIRALLLRRSVADSSGVPDDTYPIRLRKDGLEVERREPDAAGAVVFDARGPGTYLLDVAGVQSEPTRVVIGDLPSVEQCDVVWWELGEGGQ